MCQKYLLNFESKHSFKGGVVKSKNLNKVLTKPCWSCVNSDLVPLHNACSYGHYEVAELLVKVGLFNVIHTLFVCYLVRNLLVLAEVVDSICSFLRSMVPVSTLWTCGSSHLYTRQPQKTEWRSVRSCSATAPTPPSSTATTRAPSIWPRPPC